MSLISTDWLEKNIEKVKLIECSWHLPDTKRDAYKEYINAHIPNAIFFDLDKNSDQDSELPHMLPTKSSWEKIIASMGISNSDKIIVYDNSDLISSCRCWYSFIYFGHDPKLIKILNGGLKKWKLENRKITNNIPKIIPSTYFVRENKELVKNKKQIDNNISKQKFKVVDARSKARFDGKEKEPRKGIRSGSIPNSYCLPFKELINENRTFKDKIEIKKKFKNILKSEIPNNIVFSCGSGVTAAVLALAYSLIDNTYRPVLYDGSWAEYGKD